MRKSSRPQFSTPVFKDHFSGHAAQYAKFRPVYPDELFDWLASRGARVGRAPWTSPPGMDRRLLRWRPGSTSVIALDASAAQLTNASPHDRLEYRRRASRRDRARGCVGGPGDRRAGAALAGPRAVLRRSVANPPAPRAACRVGLQQRDGRRQSSTANSSTSTPASSDPYWPPERAIVEARYEPVVLPFDEIACAAFCARTGHERLRASPATSAPGPPCSVTGRPWVRTRCQASGLPSTVCGRRQTRFGSSAGRCFCASAATPPDPPFVPGVRAPTPTSGTFVRRSSLTTTKTIVDNAREPNTLSRRTP